jgi:hypothetical protein
LQIERYQNLLPEKINDQLWICCCVGGISVLEGVVFMIFITYRMFSFDVGQNLTFLFVFVIFIPILQAKGLVGHLPIQAL